MTDDRAKTLRTLLIADHLWETFASMASEMGSERDALLNQALYTFARLNGFPLPSDPRGLWGAAAPEAPPQPSASVPPPPPRPVLRATSAPGPARLASASPVSQHSEKAVEVDDSLLGDDAPQATSRELPNLADRAVLVGGRHSLAPAWQEPPEAPDLTPQPSGNRTLVLLGDGRELDRVLKERFLIGRGKHCDLIINSGKVSREHAAISREGGDYFIEDLGSSNGTWHEKRRISRRQIQEGDDYFICAEKLSCTFR